MSIPALIFVLGFTLGALFGILVMTYFAILNIGKNKKPASHVSPETMEKIFSTLDVHQRHLETFNQWSNAHYDATRNEFASLTERVERIERTRMQIVSNG